MSKFVIACPVCSNYVEANTGFFASRHIRCSCGNVINVKTDRMAPGCVPPAGTMWFTIRPKAKAPNVPSATRSW